MVKGGQELRFPFEPGGCVRGPRAAPQEAALIATCRLRRVSRARYTSPMPPAPMGGDNFERSQIGYPGAIDMSMRRHARFQLFEPVLDDTNLPARRAGICGAKRDALKSNRSNAQAPKRTRPSGSVHRHQTLQLLEPVLHDDHVRRRAAAGCPPGHCG